MASYLKRKNTWRAQVALMGKRLTASFDTKSQAIAWATEKEAAIRAGRLTPICSDPPKLFAAALDRYAEEVSTTKKGARWECIRIAHFKASIAWVNAPIAEIQPEQLAQWRDQRLKKVKSSTVNRELNLLSAIFEHARKEWKWITHNPAKEIKRPSNPRPRDRRISLGEQMQMLKALKFELGQIPTRVSHHLATAFLFALETAMRKGEILSLTWDDVFLSKRYVRLLDSKNGDGRHIPLSKTAVALLEQQPRHDPQKRCFPIPLNSSDALWRKARQRAQITDLHFHDTRHEAITRLAKKLDVLELARMVGHRDVRSLMIYYNATATELAERLD